MFLLDVCRYIKAHTNVGEGISAGIIDEDAQRYIGVYENQNLGAQNKPKIGGTPCTKHFEKAVTVRIHWSKNTDEAECKAQEIYNLFYGVTKQSVGAFRVAFFDVRTPVFLGRTENGVCEYAVEVKIIYEKEENE
ncbi:MAG: minor capsid protein [Candidatus Fimenecus sp.]